MITKIISNNFSKHILTTNYSFMIIFFYFVNYNCRNPRDEYIYANYNCTNSHNDFFLFYKL